MDPLLYRLLQEAKDRGKIPVRAFVRNAVSVLDELEQYARSGLLSPERESSHTRACCELREPLEDYLEIEKTYGQPVPRSRRVSASQSASERSSDV